MTSKPWHYNIKHPKFLEMPFKTEDRNLWRITAEPATSYDTIWYGICSENWSCQ